MLRKIKFLPALLLIIFSIQLSAQDWIVPEDQSALSNPVDYTLENVKKGRDAYMLNCKSCHGDPGKNNALPLVPLPPDVSSEKMQANSEGDLFYKISNGKGAMPQFETVLSVDDRWRVVNFIMNYNPKRTAVLIEVPPVKAKIWASVNEESRGVDVLIEVENKKGEFIQEANIPVHFSAKKVFGNLKIGEAVTREDGKLEFIVPESTIGDEEGLVNIVVSLSDDYDAKEVVLENAKIATPKHVTKLIRPGIIWSTNDNMPMWLLISFVGIVSAAWITILYVLFQIVKIKRSGKE